MSVTTENPSLNGVDVATLFATLDAVKGQPEIAKFQFRATTSGSAGPTAGRSTPASTARCRRWSTPTRPRSSPTTRPCSSGQDNGPTPVEYLLHAISACLTSGIANIAAARGVTLNSVSSTVEGDIDLLGILGLSDGSVRNGYEQIKVTFHIDADADEETVRGLVEQSRKRSAVYDALTNPTPVVIDVVTS